MQFRTNITWTTPANGSSNFTGHGASREGRRVEREVGFYSNLSNRALKQVAPCEFEDFRVSERNIWRRYPRPPLNMAT